MAEPAAERTQAGEDDAHGGLDEAVFEAVHAALDADDLPALKTAVADLHVADLADLIEQLPREARLRMVEALGDDLDPELLSELHGPVLADLLDMIGPKDAAAALAELDTDDAVYVLNEVDEGRQREMLEAMAPEERRAVEAGLNYPPQSAGRLMQTDLVAVPDYWSIGRIVEHLRWGADLPDRFHAVIVVDNENRPVGVVPLDRLLRTGPDLAAGLIMDEVEHVISVDLDQEDVAFRFQQYRLVTAPVVDEKGRLAGVITADDVADVIEQEVEEDAMRLGGVAQSDLQDSVWTTTRSRFAWLFVNLGTAILASAVIGLFDAAIEKIVALAVLSPIVASMGGNAATQTLTVAVRTLATRELTSANARRIVLKELTVGLVNGVLFAVLVGGVAYLWFGSLTLGFVFAAAMVVNMAAGALGGVLIPLGLARMGADPAIASGVFVTTVTDVVGFFAFLGLATLFLV